MMVGLRSSAAVLAGASMALVACTDASEGPEALRISSLVLEEGTLELPARMHDSNPTTLAREGTAHGYRFHGLAGGVVHIQLSGVSCLSGAPAVELFGPDEASASLDMGRPVASGAEAACHDERGLEGIELPRAGGYLLAIGPPEGTQGDVDYGFSIRCVGGPCQSDDGDLTFVDSRLDQQAIDAGQVDVGELSHVGAFLFHHVFRTEEGMGNALMEAPGGTRPRPNMRRVHFGSFGGPDAQSCVTCHNQGGPDGAGDLDSNIFQAGDGLNRDTANVRNPPALLGAGYRQALGLEMTRDLQAQRLAAIGRAMQFDAPVEVELMSKGVEFGTLVVDADGRVDYRGLQGVDPDLEVKPFGRKGRVALLRDFVEGGFRVHFGMQAETTIDADCRSDDAEFFKYCRKMGDGPCVDPDMDGVRNELTEGQLTAMSLYLALLAIPTPPEADLAGERVFEEVDCGTCHRRSLPLDEPGYFEPSHTTDSMMWVSFEDAASPRPPGLGSGPVEIELWSDFRRYDMGDDLADLTSTDARVRNIAPSHFITTPLWDLAASAPYLHDGRAETLDEAIRLHDGDARESRDAYEDLSEAQRKTLLEFLEKLGRPQK